LSIVIGIALYGAMFAVPIFAQSILRFTSEQTGLLLLPGAIASAVTMVIASRVVRRFDPRIVLTCGGLTLVSSMLWLGQLSVSTGQSQLFGPLLLRAVGTVFMFLPLNLATIGPIPRQDVAKATGFFNLTRQLGGSIGVALLSTVLDQRMAFHRANLVSHLTPGDPQAVERISQLGHVFGAQGASDPTAHAQALGLLDGMVQRQASVLSFNDTFFVTSALVLMFLPLVLLLGKPSGEADLSAAH
jgi:DHA2 family multidrug resistance protein